MSNRPYGVTSVSLLSWRTPPPWLATPPPRDGWLGRSASALTKRTCCSLQVLLPLLQSDLYDIMQSCVNGNLPNTRVYFSEARCVAVVLTSQGYPGSYKKGMKITGESQNVSS